MGKETLCDISRVLPTHTHMTWTMTPMPDTASRSTAFNMAWEMVSNRCSGSCNRVKLSGLRCTHRVKLPGASTLLFSALQLPCSRPCHAWCEGQFLGYRNLSASSSGRETGQRKQLRPESVIPGNRHTCILSQGLNCSFVKWRVALLGSGVLHGSPTILCVPKPSPPNLTNSPLKLSILTPCRDFGCPPVILNCSWGTLGSPHSRKAFGHGVVFLGSLLLFSSLISIHTFSRHRHSRFSECIWPCQYPCTGCSSCCRPAFFLFLL